MKQLIFAAILLAAQYSNANAQGMWVVDRITSDTETQYLPQLDDQGQIWWWQAEASIDGVGFVGSIVRDGSILSIPNNGMVRDWDWTISRSGEVAYAAFDLVSNPQQLSLYWGGNSVIHGVFDSSGVTEYRGFWGLSFDESGEFACLARHGADSYYINQGDKIELVNDDGTTSSFCQYSLLPDCSGSYGPSSEPWGILGKMSGEWWYQIYDREADEYKFVSQSAEIIPQPPGGTFEARVLSGELLVLTAANYRLLRFNPSTNSYERWSRLDEQVVYWAFDGQTLAYSDLESDLVETIKVRYRGVDLPPIPRPNELTAGLDVRGDTVVWASWGEQGGYGEIYRATWQPTNAVGDSWGLYE